MNVQQAKITKKKLSKECRSLLKKLQIRRQQIKELDKIILTNCTHKWIITREQCMYGEKFTTCQKCGIDATTTTSK